VKKEVVVYGVVQKIKVDEPQGAPSLFGFAASINVCIDTVNEWRKVHKEFSASVRKARCLQADWIIKAGSQNTAPTAWSIFMMKNISNWTDKQEIKTEQHISVDQSKINKLSDTEIESNIKKELEKD
ncbi:MAG: hypothetical protein DRP08_07810, partial [Candidatus Aenigmatarchaeota archaeon]